MKNSLLIWIFIVGIVVTVFVAFNYQSERDTVSLNEIFPEDDFEREVQFEFIGVDDAQQKEVDTMIEMQEETIVVEEPQKIVTRVAETAPSPPKPEPVVKPAVPEVQVTTSKYSAKYTIQVASLKSKLKAEEEVARAKQKGFDAFNQMRDLGEKGIWYRVYVGQYASKAEAEKILPKVRQSYANAFIIAPKK